MVRVNARQIDVFFPFSLENVKEAVLSCKQEKRKENLRIASTERRLHLVLTKVLFL